MICPPTHDSNGASFPCNRRPLARALPNPNRMKYLTINYMESNICRGKNILDAPSLLVHHRFTQHYW